MAHIADSEVDVATVLDELGLTLAGRPSNDWDAVLCPFHAERRPSTSINLDHGGWTCKHDPSLKGGLIKLVALLKDISYDEAVVWLVGRKLPTLPAAEQLTKAIAHVQGGHPTFVRPDDKGDVVEWAARYDALPTDRMAKYFFDRGFTERTMQDFGVRYDAEERALVWPMRDAQFNLKGFIMRRLPGQGEPKYLYPYGCRVSTLLFPLSHYSGDEAILVEGPLDAMWLHQAGAGSGLALLGDSISKDQVQLLRGIARSVVLAMDNDPQRLAHAKNGKREDTRPSNLEFCEDQACFREDHVIVEGAGTLATMNLKQQLGGQFQLRELHLPPGIKDLQEVPIEQVQGLLDNAERRWYSEDAQPKRRRTP
jgi:hypothetical protein